MRACKVLLVVKFYPFLEGQRNLIIVEATMCALVGPGLEITTLIREEAKIKCMVFGHPPAKAQASNHRGTYFNV